MARRSIALNHLDEQMTVHTIDLKDSLSVVRHNSCDLVVCNPPYFKGLPTNKTNPNKHLAIARHEIHTTLEEVIDNSSKLLKTNGRFAMVHRPERFLEIIQIMQNHRIAPKRIQFVYPKAGKEANILLVEGIKEGKLDGFKVAPPLITYDADGNTQQRSVRCSMANKHYFYVLFCKDQTFYGGYTTDLSRRLGNITMVLALNILVFKKKTC